MADSVALLLPVQRVIWSSSRCQKHELHHASCVCDNGQACLLPYHLLRTICPARLSAAPLFKVRHVSKGAAAGMSRSVSRARTSRHTNPNEESPKGNFHLTCFYNRRTAINGWLGAFAGYIASRLGQHACRCHFAMGDINWWYARSDLWYKGEGRWSFLRSGWILHHLV